MPAGGVPRALSVFQEADIMIRRIAAALIGAAALLSASAPSASLMTVFAEDAYAFNFTIGGSRYVEREIEKKYGADGIALYRTIVGQMADYACNGADIEDRMLITVDRSIKVKYEQGSAIVGYVFKNNPQFYWLGNAWKYDMWRPKGDTDWYIGDIRVAVIDEFRDGAHRKDTSAELARVLDDYHRLVAEKNTTLEKLMAVNDKIDADTFYTSADDISHRSIGCLLRRECVCEGYSKAFQLICNREGLGDTLFVEGIGYNGSTSEAHGWNIIEFDGAWYYVDSTWNDILLTDQHGNYLDNSERWHDYFMRGSAYMEYDHTINAHLYAGSDQSDPMKYLDYPPASPVDLKAYIYGSSMKLGEGMEYTLYCAAVDDDVYDSSNFSMLVTIDGAEQDIKGIKKNVDGREVVAFTMDIPVKNIADSISGTLTVQDSDDGLSFSADYSLAPKDYLTELYEGSEGTQRALAAAALNYAAAAQEYKSYNTASLANAGIAAEDKAIAPLTPDMLDGGYQLADRDNGVSITAAALDMMSKTRIRVYFRLDESYSEDYADGSGRAEARITAPDGSVTTTAINSAYEKLGRCGRDGELYWVETKGISPVSYAAPVTIEITADGKTPADSLTYSVHDYFKGKCASSSGIEKLAAAMYAYGKAAEAYVG